MERGQDRFLSADEVDKALEQGDRIPEGDGKYRVFWKKWVIIAAPRKCHIYLITAYHE
ncbi:MAG: DUF4258 domain-containing protein [Nitrososphaerota archaeon]|nr:DUF4258 domain-containing protein [Nitrososphaerota archaeon]MDG6935476.1 DUF4258 domain-containing protein [Nitrososphaerota archaeon]MDG6943609.1 DUF4258 domain-containing protein [Nitrososphaerota archaeon]